MKTVNNLKTVVSFLILESFLNFTFAQTGKFLKAGEVMH